MSATEPRPGEIIVDAQRTANMVSENRRLYNALQRLEGLHDAAAEIEAASSEARSTLANLPEFDHLPTFVQVDSSWADELPRCVACGEDVPWADALLMPCSTVEDGDVDSLGVVHLGGCPTTALPPSEGPA